MYSASNRILVRFLDLPPESLFLSLTIDIISFIFQVLPGQRTLFLLYLSPFNVSRFFIPSQNCTLINRQVYHPRKCTPWTSSPLGWVSIEKETRRNSDVFSGLVAQVPFRPEVASLFGIRTRVSWARHCIRLTATLTPVSNREPTRRYCFSRQ